MSEPLVAESVSKKWLSIESAPIDLSYRLDLDGQMAALFNDLSEKISEVQKQGYSVERLQYRNILDQSENPTGDRPFVRIICTKN